MYAMISAKDTRSAMRDDWTTLAPQSGPMVDTSNESADQPNCPATWFATSVAASGEVFDVRTRNPCSPSLTAVCTTASGSPASENALRTSSMPTSPVARKLIEVPPWNSMPKFSPRTPTTTATAAIMTAAMMRNVRRWPTKLMSRLMKRPLTLRGSRPACSAATRSWQSLTSQKPGCFAMARGASRRMSGIMNTSIATTLQAMPSASVRPKPFTEALARKNRVSAETSVTRSAVDGGADAVAHARDGGRSHASAHAHLLADALEHEDGRVGRHADGQHDARDARKRQAEQAERDSKASRPR